MIIEVDTWTRPATVFVDGQQREGARVVIDERLGAPTQITLNGMVVDDAMVVVDGVARASSHPALVIEREER